MMDDLSALRTLGTTLDPDTPEPAGLRARVLPGNYPNDVRRPRSHRPGGAPGHRRPGRLGRRLMAMTTLAAAVTGVVAVLQAPPTGLGAGAAGTGPGSVGPGSTGAGLPAAAADNPVQVLHNAALAAAAQPALAVRPDQFVYSEVQIRLRVQAKAGNGGSNVSRQLWRPVDASRDGLMRNAWMAESTVPVPGCRDGRRRTYYGDTEPYGSERCSVDPASAPYLSELPTESGAVLRWLYAHSPGTVGTRDSRAFTLASLLLVESYVPPQARAALFDAIARIPGSRSARSTDADGRPALGVAHDNRADRITDELLFDPRTYAFRGFRSTSAGTLIAPSLLSGSRQPGLPLVLPATPHYPIDESDALGRIDYRGEGVLSQKWPGVTKVVVEAAVRLSIVDRAGQQP